MRHTKRYGSIAQLGEHLPYKQRVIGSSPIVPTTIFLTYGSIAQLGEHLPYKQRVIGSSPIVPTICGPVVQLVRMPACHAGGRGFEPHPDRHYSLSKLSCFASVAQSVEQGTENPRVGGSIPPGGTIFNECHWHSLKNNTSVLRNRKLALGNMPVAYFNQRGFFRRKSDSARERSIRSVC